MNFLEYVKPIGTLTVIFNFTKSGVDDRIKGLKLGQMIILLNTFQIGKVTCTKVKPCLEDMGK